jgi:NADH-quinone oxidoreductase subunit F
VPFPYKMTTICFVGPSAYVPIHSAMTLFPEAFEALVTKRAERRRIPVAANITAEPAGATA